MAKKAATDPLAEMRKASKRTKNECTVGQAIQQLDPRDRATVLEAMADPIITARAIIDWAKDRFGWDMHITTLRHHRGGRCSCEQA